MAQHSTEEWAGDLGERWDAYMDVFESMIAPAGAALMARAGVRPGESVVDIGCGGGATTLELAQAAGKSGRATGLDVSPRLIERAKARMRAAGAGNASFECADAQTARPAAAPFDRAFSRFGVMFFDDTDRAFANIRTWLKPGGALVFGCWGAPEDNPWMGVMLRTLGEFVELPPPDPLAPSPFRLADPEATRAMLERAGFADIALEMWRGEQHVGGGGADPARAARFVLEGMGLGEAVEEQAPERMDEVRARLETELAQFYRDGAVRAPAAIWIVTARNS